MIQIEVTTACDLNCSYCFRDGSAIDVAEGVVEKLIGCDREYVLYGYGEPLKNRNLRKIVERLDGRIMLSTNGINDISEIVEVVDRIGFSLDSTNEEYLRKVRRGSNASKILENLKKAGEKAFIESVITSENIKNLRELVELASNYGIDVKLTNVVAPNRWIYEKAIYFEPSKMIIDMLGFGNGSKSSYDLNSRIDEDFIVKVIHDCSRGKGKFLDRYREILRDAGKKGYLVNLSYILESSQRIYRAIEAEKTLGELKEFASELGVDLDVPEFFGDAIKRECPYKNSIFVRADGKVSSCMSFSRPHTEFMNNHERKVNAFIVGNLNFQEYDEVVQALSDFERKRDDMSTFPWCADCPHVSGCWYIEHNQDCYVNNPTCGECLYSVGISKCVF